MAVDELHFLQGRDKAPVAAEAGLALMIEDAPKNALSLLQAGIPVLLFGTLYNADVADPTGSGLLQRCSDWQDVLDRILRHGRQSLSAGA